MVAIGIEQCMVAIGIEQCMVAIGIEQCWREKARVFKQVLAPLDSNRSVAGPL
jgi:hypothetical protein